MEKTEKESSLDMDELSKRLKVLFWDDEANGKKETLFKEIFLGLRDQGWAPTIEKNSKHALERILCEQYDAVVLDLLEDDEPVGLELLKKIRAKKPFLPIVMFTISREMQHLKAAVRGEVSYYLEFPVSGYHEIIKAVEVAIVQEKAKKKMVDKLYYASLGQLAGGVAHFIKNSLWNIGSRAQLLMEKEESGSDTYEVLDTMKRRCDDANKVVIDLLNYARGGHDDQTLRRFDIIEQINNVLELLRIEFQQLAITVIKEFEVQEAYVYGNDFELREAFLNIMKNAIEAMPTGGKLIIRAVQVDKIVKIDITDTGTGMSKDVLANIFIPFYSTKENATGFGLFETQRIIAKSEGTIDISSAVGQGTEVTLKFPLK